MAFHGEELPLLALIESFAGGCSVDRRQEQKQVSELRKSTAKEGGKWPPQPISKQSRNNSLDALEREHEPFKEIENLLLELGAHQTSPTWLESSEAETVNLQEIENLLLEVGAHQTSLTSLESLEPEIVTQKEDVDEIDLPDVNNVQSGVQYIKQLYAFYNEQQHVGRPTDYMRYRTEINAGMRVKLVRALILVHNELHLQPETLYLAVSIMDRFLSLHHVPRTELHVVGISSLLIATKYEEDWVPTVYKFIRVSGAEFSNDELCFYEKEVLNTLDWYLTVPTVYMFLIRFVKATKADEELENQIDYYGKMGLMEYSLILYCPSMVAAATVYAARCTLRRNPLWTDTLQRHTSYSESQVLDCAKTIIQARLATSDSQRNRGGHTGGTYQQST